MARSIRAQILLGVVLMSVHAAEPSADPASVTYTYDDLGRLRTGEFTGGAASNRKIDYQYDPAGNRTTMTSGLAPTFEVGAAASSVTEGASLVFPVTRRGTSSSNVTVDCVPQDKTARASSPAVAAPYNDYATAPRTVTFLPTDPSPTTKNCLIQTIDDDFYEGTQTLTVVLQNASAGAVIDPAHGSADGNILDNESAPVFTFQNGSATEGSAIALSITRAGKSEPTQSVTYSTANGTATTADNDYTPASGTLTFGDVGPAQQQRAFSIATTADGKFEGNETISVQWQVGGSSRPAGTATISNNDAGPSIVINNPSVVNEGTPVTFTVSNVGNRNTTFAHSISWATANGTATAGSDYVASSGTVTFANGEASKSIQVTTVRDGVNDGGNETFVVNLSTNGSSAGASIGDSQGTATIADADNPQPSTPANLRQSPGGNTPTYQILWNASTGAVSTYVLEQNRNSTTWAVVATVNANTLVYQFNNRPSGDYEYRVKACGASNLCSGYSNVVHRTVCNGMCN